MDHPLIARRAFRYWDGQRRVEVAEGAPPPPMPAPLVDKMVRTGHLMRSTGNPAGREQLTVRRRGRPPKRS